MIRTEIVDAGDFETVGSTANVFPDVHIASSCMQKALRRGDRVYAHGAAEMLRQCDEGRLWRRLVVCAFEDFGLVDLGLTARVVAAASSKNFRLTLGEARVLHHLIDKLLESSKDRRLDDLYALAAAAFTDRSLLRRIEHDPLAEVLAPLVHQTTRLVASCERAVPRHSFRALSMEAVERALAGMVHEGLVDEGLFELCAKGLRLSKCLLPLLLPLTIEATEACGGLGKAILHDLPEVPLVEGIPAYAIDGFTRAGRAILAELVKHEPSLRPVLSQVLPSGARLDVLHHLLFFAEGGCCTPEIEDPLSDALKSQAIGCGARLPFLEAGGAVALMRELLPTIHAMRGKALRGFPSTHQENLS